MKFNGKFTRLFGCVLLAVALLAVYMLRFHSYSTDQLVSSMRAGHYGLVNLALQSGAKQRMKAAKALSVVATPKAVSLLLQLADDPDYLVRLNTMSDLSNLTEKDAVSLLMKLTSDSNLTVVSFAMRHAEEFTRTPYGFDKGDPRSISDDKLRRCRAELERLRAAPGTNGLRSANTQPN